MLTFDAIRKVVNEEKERQALAKLPENFFEETKAYLRNKERLAKGKEDLWEAESLRRLLQDMMEMRERKILQAALFYTRSGVEPENLAGGEEALFRSVAGVVRKFREEREGMLKETSRLSLVALLGDLPEFVGTDLKAYGPYRQGDVATVPEDAAKVLAEKKFAKIIEVK
ncbi:MAG: DNA replication complex GINS family protein [Candidatus Aenigmarchaeota archaeon]|nr:DNA replication complex GINS family protein [Candidatus Aenigmarchaeota archaeon]